MKMNAIRLMLAFCAMLAAVQAFACAAITKKGTQCKRAPSPGSQYCWQHGGTTAAQRAAGLTDADVAMMRCKAITKAGTQCKRAAQSGSKYCWQHAGIKGVNALSSEAVPVEDKTVVETNLVQDAETGASKTPTASERVQCDAITKKGNRCSRKALQGGTKCWQHAK